MAKSSVLTPVLAGVLGVSVIGSGVAYYNVYVKNADKDSDGKSGKKKDSSISLTVDEAAENIEAQIDKAQKIAKGEFDEGYKGTISYTPPTSGELGELGLKQITIGAEAKQKDKMSGMDYTMAYDSTNLLTVNIVYDNENETAYVSIPELSDAYLYGTSEEIESWMNSNVGNPIESFTTINPDLKGGYDDLIIEDSAYTNAGSALVTGTAAAGTPDLSALEDVDFGAIFEDLATYVDTIQENVPEASDADDYKVENGGESITLTTKRYTITQSDAIKIVDAIAEKGKGDATLKDFCSKMGIDSTSYDSMWTSLTDNMADGTGDDESKPLVVDVYYNGDDVQGFKATSEGEEDQIYFVFASDDEKMIFDCDTNMSGDTVKGSGLVTMKDDTLNGSITMSSEGSDPAEFTVTYDGLTATEDVLTGKLIIDGKADDQTFNITYDFNCKGDDADITVSGNAAGQEIGTLNIKTQKTDASDIAVPSGTGYKLSDEQELQTYISTCNVEGWMTTLQGALGDELYGQIFGAMGGMGTPDYSTEGEFDFGTDDSALNDFQTTTGGTDGAA